MLQMLVDQAVIIVLQASASDVSWIKLLSLGSRLVLELLFDQAVFMW